jgi:hypothetical protein
MKANIPAGGFVDFGREGFQAFPIGFSDCSKNIKGHDI